MKNFLFFPAIAALFLISCSDSDKFNISSNPELGLENIYCEQVQNEPYIYARTNLSLKNRAEYVWYWIIDEKYVNNYSPFEFEEKVSYGEHLLKFVLIDSFGDSLTDSCVVSVNEPLKITPLSPIKNYAAAKTDTIVFQYKISGVDTWEENLQISIYISTDKDVFEKGEIENNPWVPPQSNQTYYWGIKAFIGQDTAFSEPRRIWIKK
jgi:hypothetical protein